MRVLRRIYPLAASRIQAHCLDRSGGRKTVAVYVEDSVWKFVIRSVWFHVDGALRVVDRAGKAKGGGER